MTSSPPWINSDEFVGLDEVPLISWTLARIMPSNSLLVFVNGPFSYSLCMKACQALEE